MKNSSYQSKFLKSLFLLVSIFIFFSSQALFATPLSINKWKPGHYVKLDDWQVYTWDELTKTYTFNTDGLEVAYDELEENDALRGLKIVIQWGRYETRTGSTSTYNFSDLITIAEELEARGKHLILSFAWRAFSTNPDVAKWILPNDMQNTNGIYDNGGSEEHTLFDKMYA